MSVIKTMAMNIEKKSRIILGVMAIILLLMFFGFSFGYSDTFLIGMVATGILLSILVFSEISIISYVKAGKYRNFTIGDAVVIFGAIVGASVLIFSLSLIPMIGNVLPKSIINFTSTFAKVIAGLALIAVSFFMATPKFS